MAAIAYKLKIGSALRLTVFSITVFLMLIAISCAVGGRKISKEVTRTFESYQVLPDHRYYHIGWETRPYAIVALNEPYHIAGKLWLKFDANPETLKKRVDALDIFYERGYEQAFGYYLSDEAGNYIGVWYSSISIFSATVNNADNTVAITMDRPWVTGDRFGL